MNIHVGHYSNTDEIGYESWAEPEDKSWIVFVPTDHSGPVLFSHRNPTTGAVEN